MTHPTFEPQDDPVPVTFPVLEPYERPSAPSQSFYQNEQPTVATSPVSAPPRGKTAVVVLSILLALSLSTAGAFGVLYFDQKQESSRLTGQVAKKDIELADAAKKVKDSGDDLTKAKSATKIAEDAQKRAEDAQKRAEDEAGLSSQCREASRKLREAAIVGDEAKAETAALEIFTVC